MSKYATKTVEHSFGRFVCEIPQWAGKVVSMAQVGTAFPSIFVLACENGAFILTTAGVDQPASLLTIAECAPAP